VRRSRDWHMQGRGHLPPAVTEAGLRAGRREGAHV
jgi:hypothetical protein